MKTIRVAAAVIRDGFRLFVTARGYGEYKGYWEFPGGKIEPGETPQEAVKREIMEELNTEIQVGELIDTIEYDYPDFHLSMDCFWCTIVSGNLELKEASEAKWMDRVDLVRERKRWIPADWPFVDSLPKTLWDAEIVQNAKETAEKETKELMIQLHEEEEAGKFQIDLKARGAQAKHQVYEDIALKLIQERYPKADETCFSGRYTLMEENGKDIFIDRASSWEYPGEWYPNGSPRTTGEDRIESLVEEGIFRFKMERKGKFESRLYEF